MVDIETYCKTIFIKESKSKMFRSLRLTGCAGGPSPQFLAILAARRILSAPWAHTHRIKMDLNFAS